MSVDPRHPSASSLESIRPAMKGGTLAEPLPAEPMRLFASWLDDAVRLSGLPNPTSMSLATATPDGVPSVRIVLCRAVLDALGAIVFYTNYDSRKGEELKANPHAAATFHWDTLDRQVRIEGLVTRSPASESDDYFANRPLMSRVGAWASRQSRPIASRQALIEQAKQAESRFGITGGDAAAANLPPERQAAIHVPRPPNWGGYRLWVRSIEFWLGDTARLHDRAVWARTLTASADGYTATAWSITRLQP